jgi:hypothetical protein
MNNSSVIINRTRDAARKLAAALEEARAANAEFIALGGTAWTDPYFLDDQGAPRTDLDITSADFTNSQSGLDAIASFSQTSGNIGFLLKVK